MTAIRAILTPKRFKNTWLRAGNGEGKSFDEIRSLAMSASHHRFQSFLPRAALMLCALLVGLLIFDLFFILFPSRLPPLVQVMALRGPWGDQVRLYNGMVRRHRDRFALKGNDFTIRHHPEFPDHRVKTVAVPGMDLWLRDTQADTVEATTVFLGDSFTFGYGIPETDRFTSVIARDLQWNTLNTGVPWYGAYDAWKTLEQILQTKRPSRAVYFLYANDLSDDLQTDRNLKMGRLTPGQENILGPAQPSEQKESLTKRFRSFLSHWSTAYELCKMLTHQGDYKSITRQMVSFPTAHGQQILTPAFLFNSDHDYSLDHTEGLQRLQFNLTALHRLAKAHGVTLWVIYLPSREQVYFKSDLFNEEARRHPMDHAPASLVSHTQDALRKWATREKVAFYDLTTDLQSLREEQPLFFHYDRHFNIAGHQAVARLITNFLKRRGA